MITGVFMNNAGTYKHSILYCCVIVCTLIISSSTKTVYREQKIQDHNALLVEIDDESDLDFLDDLDQDLNVGEQAVLESTTQQDSPCYTHTPKGLLEYIYAGIVYVITCIKNIL
jgi:hypothetical protein